METSWLLKVDEQVTVNNDVAVYQALHEEESEAERVALVVGGATERSRSPMDVYIPRCLTPALLTGIRSPCVAWSVLQYFAKNLRI